MEFLLTPLSRLGRFTIDLLASLGHAGLFFVSLVRALGPALRRPYLIVAQIHAVGNRSLIIIMASGLVIYGAAESLGLIVNLALVRELGPVVAGLLFAGRAGTSLTAEIGLMKAGEQIAAMDLMAVDPMQRVLAPRFAGGLVSMPILAILFSAVGIIGAYVVAVLLIGIDAGNFWSIMQSRVDVIRDVGNGVIKSIVFGLICTFVALYQGYESEATPEGVAYATTRTVVFSSLGILFMDFILTALMFTTA